MTYKCGKNNNHILSLNNKIIIRSGSEKAAEIPRQE
jgi:hypothetical protein